MRLLLVVHQFLPRHVTGTEQYVRSVARGLQDRGHELTVLAFEPLIQHEAPGRLWFARDEVCEGIRVRRVSVHPDEASERVLGDFDNPLAAILLRRLLDERTFDLVHVFHPRMHGLAALEEPRRRGIPVVVHLMDFWFLCPNFMLLRRDGALCSGPPDGGYGCVGCIDPALARAVEATGLAPEVKRLAAAAPAHATPAHTALRKAWALTARLPRTFGALARADAVVAPSRSLRALFEGAGFPAGRIEHMPYGVDETRLAGYTPHEPTDLLVIGYVGSITPHKGLHVLLEAVHRLREAPLAVRVHGHVGTDPEYGKRIERLAARDRRVTLCGAFAPLELGKRLAECDLLVVPSLWYENTPFTLLEALAVGMPVLASDLGGIREVVVPGQNGGLFAAGDAAALAELLLQHVPRAARRRGEGVRPGSFAANLDALVALYERVLAARAVASR